MSFDVATERSARVAHLCALAAFGAAAAGCASAEVARARGVELPADPAAPSLESRTLAGALELDGAPGRSGATRLVLRHESDVAAFYRVAESSWVLDGARLPEASAEKLSSSTGKVVLDAPLARGEHELRVEVSLVPREPAVLGHDRPAHFVAKHAFHLGDPNDPRTVSVRLVALDPASTPDGTGAGLVIARGGGRRP